MANIRCDLKNIRPRPIRGFLSNNEVIFKDTEIGLPIPYVVKAMHRSDVYVNGKLVETFNQAASILDNIEVVDSTPDTVADKLSSIKEGDVLVLSEGDYNTPITLDKACTIKGTKGAVISSPLKITGDNVILDEVEFDVKENLAITIDNKEDVSFVNCKFTSSGESRTPIKVQSTGQAVIDSCTFSDDNNNVYNWIEFGIDGQHPVVNNTIIRNCTFKGKSKNNTISFYDMVDGANILIENCTWEYSGNAVRISNPLNASVRFLIRNCTYKDTLEGEYAGFLIFQDYAQADAVQDLTKIQVSFVNLVGPNGRVTKNVHGGEANQIYYVYDDQDGIITDKNMPVVTFA